jgi:hypothetical protein
MPVANLSPLFEPQFIAESAVAALVFATPGNPTAVPSGYFYQIGVLRVTNIDNAPVTLTLYRVPSGSTAIAVNTVVPVTVQVPVATQTFPHFDVTALWGAVLMPGDSIWALAGVASKLVIQGDGLVIQT